MPHQRRGTRSTHDDARLLWAHAGRGDLEALSGSRLGPHALAAALILMATVTVPGDGAVAQDQQAGAELEKPDFLLTPTPANVVRRMLELGGAGPDEVVADLGSGDGRIPITAARDFGARALGVEIDKLLLAKARAGAAAAGVASRVTFRDQDLFETDLSQVTVLTLYLLPSMNMRLRPRILAQMRPGARVVSHEFGFAGWLPDHRETVEGRAILLWVVPARVEGRWRVETRKHVIAIDIKQTFQEVEATASIGGSAVPLLDAHLKGRHIGFAIEHPGSGLQRFRGRIEGDAMIALPEAGAVASWRATRQ